jgi:hypothetical protein
LEASTIAPFRTRSQIIVRLHAGNQPVPRRRAGD